MSLLIVAGLSIQQPVRSDDCDPELRSDSNDPLSYQQREGRCEGLFIQPVASTSIRPVSLTAGFQDYDLSRVEALIVSWPAFAFDASTIQIRANATGWRTYYRMDALRPIAEVPFRWPIGVLDVLNMAREDIGILGWVTTKLGDSERTVYLPLTISTETAKEGEKQGYRLIVIPGVPFKEVYLSVALADSSGDPSKFIIDGKPLEFGYYPAHEPLEIPLDGFSVPGLYHVELGAKLRSGAASTLPFLVYHAVRKRDS